MSDIKKRTDRIDDICSNWPSVVPDDIVFECLDNYYQHSVWVAPLICCVCGLEHFFILIDYDIL